MTSGPEAAAYLMRNVAEALPAGALERKLAEERPLRVKFGVDPTTADIHLGHTVPLTKLREFQELGHKAVLIIGDYTARVGDPSGRSKARPFVSAEEVDANARTYREQAMRILLDDPELLELRFNSEWLDMSMESFFRLARTTTVAQILERNDFSQRWTAGQPITILETLYPLLQGYDSVVVRADVELGGTDQKFNLLLARDVQRAFEVPEQAILTMPILVGTDGAQKMSKSLDNYIGVTDSPTEIYGRAMSLPDMAMATWFDLLFGDPPPAELGPRDAKHALARRLVERYHGEEAAIAAADEFERIFVQGEVSENPDEATFDAADGTVHVPALIADVFGRTRSEARRLLVQGGVRIDGEPLSGADLDLPAERLDGVVVQVGKRDFRRLRRGS